MNRIMGIATVFALAAALAGAAEAQKLTKFKVGQRVTFQDVAGRYGGGIISGTVVKVGPYDYAVRVDVPANPAFQEIGLYEERLTAAGPAPAPEPAPVAQPAPGAQPAPAAPVRQQPAANPGTPPAGRFTLNNPPPRGRAITGRPNPNPTLARNAPTPPGRKAFYVHSRAGDEAPFGRWDLRVGGQFTNTGAIRNGRQLQEYGLPERAEAVAIKPDGTWEKVGFGKRTTGRWVDIGQNVVRLIGYDGPDDDYTASVWEGQIDIVNEVGQRYQGRRF